MKPVLLVDVVGLTSRSIGEHTPHLAALGQSGARAPIRSILPAVTCSAQATMLTGSLPEHHGAVGNGWFDRESGEVALWRQSNALVAGEKLYSVARRIDRSFTCAKIFWWWNLGAEVEWSITPRPFYPADGRKIPAIYGRPASYAAELEGELGPFPFFDFWGPKSGLRSSRWLADAAIATLEKQAPTLTLVYLPHLDYDFQRFGPADPRSQRALADIDAIVGDLVAAAQRHRAEVVVVSEYGLSAVDAPIDLNRELRRAGLLAVRQTPAGEILDVFASQAFAVCDHQIAHVYARSRAACEDARLLCASLPGVDVVLDQEGQRAFGLAHPRSGDLVAVAASHAWFTYYYWLDDDAAPDFARTVDIHRKPGYDPCELFVDPALAFPQARVALRLLQKKLGQRYLMDVIPLDARLVRGSHGRIPLDPLDGPVFLCSRKFGECGSAPASDVVEMTSISGRVLALLQRPR